MTAAATTTATTTAVTTVVRLPADPTGRALAGVVRELRAATGPGGLVVDLTGTERSSPGVRRALESLRRQAARRGCSWTVRGALPAERAGTGSELPSPAP